MQDKGQNVNKVFDVVIIGGGIAGLSSAICCATEGFSSIVCEKEVFFGGQAGSASLIENLVGYPQGVTGKELTQAAIKQAKKFGVQFKTSFNANRLKKEGCLWKVESHNDSVLAKTVLLSTGVASKKIEVSEIDKYLNNGLIYGSPSIDETYKGMVVSIVGGANSAGQAAVYLSQCNECCVNLIVRGESIESSMSHYLYERIKKIPNITLYTNSEIIKVNGDKELKSLTVRCQENEVEIPCDKAFILIGSKPETKWLEGVVPMDEMGFVITDDDLRAVEGVFCAGDARSTSIKRVSNALGEGSRVMRGIRQDILKVNEQLLLK